MAAADDIKSLLTRMGNQLGELSNQLTSLDTKVTSLENKVTALDNKVTSLDTKVASLENKVTALDTKVASLDTKVTSLDTKVTSIDNKVTSIDNKVTSIDTKVTSLETNVRDIQRMLNERDQQELGRAHTERIRRKNATIGPLQPIARLEYDIKGYPIDSLIPQPTNWGQLTVSGNETVPGSDKRSEWSLQKSKQLIKAYMKDVDSESENEQGMDDTRSRQKRMQVAEILGVTQARIVGHMGAYGLWIGVTLLNTDIGLEVQANYLKDIVQ